MKLISLVTDGSCLGNPGPGGWACILRFGGHQRELFGYDRLTTNNRMELMAPIQGLLALKERCAVTVTTDSEYVRQGITVWVNRWKRNHWWKRNRPIRNAWLWIELDRLNQFHQTTWEWTKGHAAHEDNNRCDWLAQNAARTLTSSFEGNVPHASLPLGLTADYVPPRPQIGLFDPDPSQPDDASDPG